MTTTTMFGAFLLLILKLFELQGTTSFLVSKVEIGRDTTFANGPLKPNGEIDYEAAVNEMYSRGITPDENAVVLLDRAFGSSYVDLSAELRSRFYRYLGIQEPPARDHFFLEHEEFTKYLVENRRLSGNKTQDFLDEIETTQERPWKRDEFPRIADWIDQNDEALKLVEQASVQPRFYLPIVTADRLINAPLPIMQNCRVALRLLSARCMLRIAEGNYDGAAQDILTCERLAVLIGQSSHCVCSIVGCACDAVAVGDLSVLLAQPLTIDQIERTEAAFLALPAVLDIAIPVNGGERFSVLDATEDAWRRNLSIGSWWKGVRFSWIDINVALRRFNEYFDKILRAHERIGFRDRITAIKGIADEMVTRANATKAGLTMPGSIGTSRAATSAAYADLIMGAMAPALDLIQLAEDRARMRRELVRIGFALAAYRAKHGTYPSRLDALVPKFLSQIPLDRFNDEPVHYSRTYAGYELYSVNADRIDNRGRQFDGKTGDLVFSVRHDPQLLATEYRQRRDRNIYRSLILLACFTLCWIIWRYQVLKGQPQLKPSLNTSIVEGPLKENGTIDFETALHAYFSAGVPPESNAAVLLQHAFGPPELSSEARQHFYRYLGMTELPPDGSHFVDEDVFAQSLGTGQSGTEIDREAIQDQISQATLRPWERGEFPALAKWIEVNQEPIALVERATLRPKLYSPLVNDGALWGASQPLLRPMGSVVRLLASRAMLQIAQGDFEGVIHDLVTCHRLGSLFAQSGNVTGVLVGLSMENIATHCSQVLLAQPLTSQQIQTYVSALAAIPPLGNIATTLDFGARLEMIDGLQNAAISRDTRRELIGFDKLTKFDINTAARRTIAYFDSFKRILEATEHSTQIELLNTFEKQTDLRVKRSRAKLKFFARLAWRSRTGLSNCITDIALDLMAPDVRQLLNAHEGAMIQRRMLYVGLSLAAYRAVHGCYPAALDVLIPDFLDAVPLNQAGQPIYYQLTLSGYRLNAMGADGRDDGGSLAFQVG